MGTKKIYTNLFVKGEFTNGNITYPQVDGTSGQVMVTDGGGTLTWQTVSGGGGTTINTYTSGGTYSGDTIIFTNTTGGTYSVTGITSGGSGSTSPAGSNTQIQFNDSGSFGANTGFTFDTTNQTLFTESNISGTSVNFYNGLSNFDVGFGSTEAIGTTMLYNTDPIGSASGVTIFTMGDLTDVFGADNSYLLGFINVSGNTNSFINGDPEGTRIMYTPADGGGRPNSIEVGYGGITNEILSGKTFEVQGASSNTLLNVNDSGTTFHSTYTFPTTDGSLGQVLQTDGGGSVSWATVSGGTGSTSPAGSNTQIQFNDSGSFGANTGFTYSALTNAFSTKSNYGTKSINLGSGVVDMGPFGTLTGVTANVYNNSLSGASAMSFFLQGDASPLGASDNTTFFGYFNQSTNLMSSVILNPESSTLNYNTSGATVQSTIALEAIDSTFGRSHNSLNTQSFITLTDSDTEVHFQDSNSSKSAFLDLTADAITLNLNKTGIPSGTTGFYISDTAINANLGNSGASQSFSVNNLTPSGWVKRLEVADSGSVTINESFTFPNVDGSEGQTLQTDGAGTVSWANPYIGGMFAQTGDSATVSATTTETSIVGDGVGSLSVPADSFRIGDSFHAKIGGYISSQNNAELTMRIKADGSTLTTLGPIVLPTMSNQFWELEVDFTMRVTGATGSIQTNGQFVYVQNSGNNYNGYGFNTDSSIDTTVLNELGITVEWDTTNVSNAIMSDLFYLKKCY